MPFELRYSAEEHVLVARAFGTGTPDEGNALLDALFAQALRRPGVAVLLDMTDLDYIPSSDSARVFARRLGESLTSRRVAFITSPGAAFGMARMVEQIANLRGMKSAAFTDRESALSWLHEQEPQS